MAAACQMTCYQCGVQYDARHGFALGLCTLECATIFQREHGHKDCPHLPLVA
jgi:rubredoxin